jgi:predicted phage replisome organizer
MAEEKRYYWLKLKRDFFKRHDIRIIEAQPNGKDYILFYLKLLCESVDHNGNLRFSETIPYNEEMLSTITNTNIDIVRNAIKIFSNLNMMEILDDGTFYMSEVEKMIGSETPWAEKKRNYRSKTDNGQKEDNVHLLTDNVLTLSDKSKSKSIEKDITDSTESVCRTGDVRRVKDAWNALGLGQVTAITADTTRGKNLKARINQHGVDKVLEAIERIKQSSFLQGQSKKGWIITFDWFVKPTNFLKVLEGNYDDHKEAAQAGRYQRTEYDL